MTHLDRTVGANVDLLFSMIGDIRDGNADAIHDARVATRRLRAAMPLVWADSPKSSWAEPADTIRRFGRALGRVRELDVALAQLDTLEPTLPAAGGAIAELRNDLTRRQWKERRRLIKVLEGLPLAELRTAASARGRRMSLKRDRRWKAVERAMAQQSQGLRDAVTAASGVYFPHRAHRVRVDMKKLRYVLELAPHAEGARAGVKRLKRAQEVLGRLHDHQALADLAADMPGESESGHDALLAALQSACHALFREYLEQRSQVLQVCDEVRIAAARSAWKPNSFRNALLTAGAIAAPSALLFLAQGSGRRGPKNQQIRGSRRQMFDNSTRETAPASQPDAERRTVGAPVRSTRRRA